jgi:hypothetical protein
MSDNKGETILVAVVGRKPVVAVVEPKNRIHVKGTVVRMTGSGSPSGTVARVTGTGAVNGR